MEVVTQTATALARLVEQAEEVHIATAFVTGAGLGPAPQRMSWGLYPVVPVWVWRNLTPKDATE